MARFRLKKVLKKAVSPVITAVSPITRLGASLVGKRGGAGGDPGQIIGGQRRSLQDILSDPAFQVTPEEEKAYQESLAASEALRGREEQRATENILGQLQGRGIAQSGIALKDVVSQVLGPSAERAGQLGAGLGGLRARALEEQKSRRLQAILGEQGFQNELEALRAQDALRQRREFEERRRQRKGRIGQILGGGVGSFLGGFYGGPAGASVGSQAGSTMGEGIGT